MIAEVLEHSAQLWRVGTAGVVSHGAVLVRSPTAGSYFHWLSLQTPGFSVTIITRCTQHTQKSHFYLFVVSFSTICIFLIWRRHFCQKMHLILGPITTHSLLTFWKVPCALTWSIPGPNHRNLPTDLTHSVLLTLWGLGCTTPHSTIPTYLTHSVLLTLWGLGCTTPQRIITLTGFPLCGQISTKSQKENHIVCLKWDPPPHPHSI